MQLITTYNLKKILSITIAVSLIFPLVYLYFWLFPPKIIPVGFEKFGVTPAEYAVTILGNELVKQAKEKNLRGYVMGVEMISGPEYDKEIDNLKMDINIILRRYDGWKIMASSDQLEGIKKRKKADEERKRKLIDAGFIDPRAYVDWLVASDKIKIDYDIMAKWKHLPGTKENYQIICDVINRRTGNTEFSSEVSFTHPIYYLSYKKKKEVILYGVYISGGLLGFSILVLSGMTIIAGIKRKRHLQNMPAIMEKLNNYRQKGSYTAAYSLVCQLLENDPLNTDLIAYKERLMLITKNNPKRAEEAYIRWANLGTKLSQGVNLSEEEINDLKNLPKYLELPEITKLIAEQEKSIRRSEIEKKLKSTEEHIRILLERGELSKAQSEIDSLYKDSLWAEYRVLVTTTDIASQRLALPSPERFEDLRLSVEEKFKASREDLEKSKELIARGNIYEAEQILKNITKTNKDICEVEKILSRINKSRKAEKLILNPEKIGKQIYIFKKDTITFFRKEKQTPDVDINNPRISRNHHLKLCIVENKVIAEDQYSANGTYLRGEKISRAVVEDGDILELARAYRMTVHICRGREIVQSTMVPGTIVTEMKIDPATFSDNQKIGGLFIEADDRNYIILVPGYSSDDSDGGSVCLDFKSIGIVYEKSGNCQLATRGNVFILKTPDGCQILCPGDEIDYRGVRYRINS